MTYSIAVDGIREALEHAPAHSTRVLTDRLWPRGLRKTDLHDVIWYRDASPEADLRRAYHDGSLSRDKFFRKYRQQLKAHPECLVPLMRYARSGALQLLTATHNAQESYLLVLAKAIQDALREEDEACADGEPSSPACFAHLDARQLR